MRSTRCFTRMLVISVVAAGTSVVTAAAALAYTAPPDPDPAILPPPECITTGSGHTLQWALSGLSAFLFVAVVAMASALLIARHRRSTASVSPSSVSSASVSAPSAPAAKVPVQRTSDTTSPVTPKR